MQYGTVTECIVFPDKSYGFVNFLKVQEAERAIEMKNREYEYQGERYRLIAVQFPQVPTICRF
jgi:hypothetical protein